MRSKKILNGFLYAGIVMGIGVLSTASAQAPEKSPLEQVETMVFLNETGMISITYADPWFWEVGYYAMSLWSFMADSLNAADAECAALSQALTDHPDQRLSARARLILDSQLEDGRVKDIRLISSLLKKYSHKNEIDPENSSDKGRYTPLSYSICSNLDSDTPGYMQQIFLAPKNNPETYFLEKCERVEKTAACLNDLNVIDTLNRRRQGDNSFTEVDFSSAVFSLVSGSHSDDGA